jgi:hypothetical protein
VIGLAFRLVFLTFQAGVVLLRNSWRTLGALMAALFSILTLPFVVLHHAVDRLRSGIAAGRRDSYDSSTVKPDWAMGREV